MGRSSSRGSSLLNQLVPSDRASASSPASASTSTSTSTSSAATAKAASTAASTSSSVPLAMPGRHPSAVERRGAFLALDVQHLYDWIRQGWLVIAGLALIGALAGASVVFLVKPRFTATSEVLVDPAGLKVVSEDLYASAGQLDGQMLAAASKLRVLSSGNVLSQVVKDLDLVRDREFVPADATGDPTVIAVANLRKRVKVESDQRSFVASLAVTTEDAAKSIDISATMIASFRKELAKAESDGASRSVTGLEDRLSELKDAVNKAEEQVETYKREKGLQPSVAGELTSQTSLNQLNTQVLEAQRLVIAEEAAYKELVSGRATLASADNPETATLAALRTQYAQTQQQLGVQSIIYGARHPVIARLQSAAKALETQIAAESGRLRVAAKARLDRAQAALAALTSRSSSQSATVFTDNEALVQLRELERDAQSKAAVYEAFLARAQQLNERGQLDTTNIRVISTALPPQNRSWPPSLAVLLVIGTITGSAIGLTIAIAKGIWREIKNDKNNTNIAGNVNSGSLGTAT